MTKRTRKFMLLLALTIVAGVGVGFGVIVYLGHRLRPFAPYEFTHHAGSAFKIKFPGIYHFLVEHQDYEAVHFRVLHGLGGRWGKLTLKRNEAAATDRETIAGRLRGAFKESEWQIGAPSAVVRESDDLLFEAGPGELSSDDLIYSHAQLGGEWEFATFHNCRVFVAGDDGKIVAYCEMGW